jgi:hypothetical protein
MEMKWFFVNDVMHVYIKIVMEYRLYQMEHGFVNHVQFYDDQLVYFVQSKICLIINNYSIFMIVDLVVQWNAHQVERFGVI